MWSEIVEMACTVGAGSLWVPILFDAALKGTVLLGLAGVATLLMRRSSAAARHLVWCLAVTSLPALPILSAVSPDWHVLPHWMAMPGDVAEEVSPAVVLEPRVPPDPAAPREFDFPDRRGDMAGGPVEPAAPQAIPPHAVEPPQRQRPAAAALPRPPAGVADQAVVSQALPWQAWGLLAWCAGTVVVFMPVGLGMLSLWRLGWTAGRISDGPWIAQLHELSTELGVSRRTILLRSSRRSMPMHWGILRPKLLLPAVADEWPEDRRRVVLLHELAHVRRRDCLAQLTAQVACALYWFNPLVWVALWRMRIECEAACDDLILRAGYRPPDYAEHLLEIVSGLRANGLAAYGAIAMARRSRLEGRLRAILDHGRNRRTLTRAAVAAIVLLLAGVVVPVAMMRAAVGRSDAGEDPTAGKATAPELAEQTGSTYDHFFYLRHNPVKGSAQTDSLVLAKVTPGGFEQRDLYATGNLHIGWMPLCAVGGRVYGIKIDDLISIDVAAGRTETICRYIWSHTYNSGRLYAVLHGRGGQVLRVFDFRQRAYRDVGPIGIDWPGRPLALSPDRKRLAFFKGQDNTFAGFRLQVLDLDVGTVETPGPILYSMPLMTGGGDVREGPPIVWLDARTLLLVHDVPKDAPQGPGGLIGAFEGEAELATLDVATGKLTSLVKLPRWNRQFREPYLRPLGSDKVPRIVMGELGQYRIDVAAKRLIEDDGIGGDYRWSRGREPERLDCGRTQLFRAESIPELGVSPDGRRLLWLTKRGDPDAELRYYDAREQTVRTIAKGWFATTWSPHRRPDESIFLWASAEELAPGDTAELPPGWKPFSTQPWPVPPEPSQLDERPDVAGFLTMELSTDKQTYKHHEPVKLTVTLTNKTDQDLTLKRPHEHTNFFGLGMDYPHGGTMIDEFERSQEVFPTDPVVIKARESFQCTRTLEPWDLGEHKVEGAFRPESDQWQGRAKAAALTFLVEKSPDEEQLLKAKFDRLLAQCRREFDTDPATCNSGRLFDLGPAAVPHLTAALEASDNPKFRQRMGYALAQMATADALPYFEKLLKGELADDGGMVLEGLLNMVQWSRSKEEALRLLLGALKHANPAVRRGAAGRLRQLHDPRVAAALEAAVKDPDAETATTAARYLAAYEGLDLADWLRRAAEQPTLARYLAARSILRQLQQQWELDKGRLPEVPGEDLANDPAALAAYRRVLRAWEQWARENPRASAHFFDDDRQHWPKEEPKPD